MGLGRLTLPTSQLMRTMTHVIPCVFLGFSAIFGTDSTVQAKVEPPKASRPRRVWSDPCPDLEISCWSQEIWSSRHILTTYPHASSRHIFTYHHMSIIFIHVHHMFPTCSSSQTWMMGFFDRTPRYFMVKTVVSGEDFPLNQSIDIAG